MLVVSSRLGPYEILAPLGAGGMGEVYRARDTRLGREVAVKVLPEAFATSPDRQARFEREARAVAALSHPNILSIHDYGTHAGVTYAVMELLEGETLRKRLSTGALPWDEAVEVGAMIAEGLAAAHARQIVHRDIKPENLFLTTDGRVKILDFGLARMSAPADPQCATQHYVPGDTDAGTVLGTVGYMSPEQVRGQPADHTSDVFSFGCVLYELVTGRRAFDRETAAETMTAILHDEPQPGDSGREVPVELERLIRQCLAKNPHQRLQSARDLALSLRAMARNSAGSTPPGGLAPDDAKTRGGRGRQPRVIAAALVLVCSMAAAVYFTSVRKEKTPIPAEPRPSINAIAVLPFACSADDPASQMLSETLVGHISDSLRQMAHPDLRIRPPSSVARYARNRPDTATIGRELNVPLIVTGTLRQTGDDLAIAVEVVDVREDNLLWSSRPYAARRGETLELDLLDQIVRDVAAHLGLELSGEERQRLTRRATTSKEAYNLYREAIYHLNKFTPEGLAAGIEAGKKAIEEDPEFAPAYVAVARCYILRGSLFEGPRKTYPEARAYVSEALRVDPDLPDAHAALGAIYTFKDSNGAEAEREFRIALNRDPNVELARNILGFGLAAQGHLDEALASIQAGQELDPLAAARWNELAMCYNAMERYDQAIAAARKAVELDPNFVLAYGEWGRALSQMRRHDAAIRTLRTAVERGKGNPRMRGLLGCAYARAGRETEARMELASLLADGRFGCAFALGRVYANLDEQDEAFEWLQKACDERDSTVFWLRTDPTLSSLRSDPRFDELLMDMGLPPQAGRPAHREGVGRTSALPL